MRSALFSLIAGLLGFACHSWSATVTLIPDADTTLIEIAPTNNLGGQEYINAGTTLTGYRNRALMFFNLTNDIPANSRITSVELALEVVGVPTDDPQNSNFQLFRVLRPWGEGNKANGVAGPGRGVLAELDEATWNDRFALTTNAWTEPGGAEGEDYSATLTAQEFVILREQSPYIFAGFPQLVSDVQLWVDQPSTNFGWILKTADESVYTTARRFGSSEDQLNAPRLTITFVPPPTIHSIASTGSQFQFAFTAEAGQGYSVEARDSLNSGNWNSITNIAAPGAETEIVITTPISSTNRFYRVKLQ